MREHCGYCARNYTGECEASDKADCFKNGRHTKFRNGSPEFCPDCGGEMVVYRTNKDLKEIDKCIPRTRICLDCKKKFPTGEFLLNLI